MSTEKWVLVSVYDKTGIVEDVRRLVKMGWKIISSGGTAKVLIAAGIPVKDVAELVGGSAILGHRVVTLSREVHAGLLADALKPEDLAELVSLNIPFIDFVRCDFYPLQNTIVKAVSCGDSAQAILDVVEGTDICGPCMVRSAAKGLRIVVCRRQDMEEVLLELELTGKVYNEFRQILRARAEFEVAKYVGFSAEFHGDGKFKIITGERVCEFKGENGPQTPAGLYTSGSDDPLALDKFQLIEGSAPSYNNWCDVDRLLQTLTHIAAAWQLNFGKIPLIAVGGKHGNGSGAATDGDCREVVVSDTVCGDTRAIFGGLIMTNFPITDSVAVAMAEAMPNNKPMFDGVIAPAFQGLSAQALARSKGKCRIMVNPALSREGSALIDRAPRFRYVRGGLLAQPNYSHILDFGDQDIKVYGELTSHQIMKDILLAYCICSTSNSNTITLVKEGMLIGNGVGQQDRVGAAELAVKRAIDAGHGCRKTWRNWFGLKPSYKPLLGAVACSDSFFPFPDGVQVLIDAGVKTIFSTSGSVNDKLIQDLCVENNVTLVQLPDGKARAFFGH